MSRKLILPAILSLMTLGACQTTPSTGVSLAPQTSAAPVQAVPCPTDPAFGYHAPKDATEAAQWLKGALPDPTNHYDTPDTVASIRRHNAAVQAVCAGN